MIVYKDIIKKLKEAGYTVTRIRAEKLISESTMSRIRRGESISTNTIDIVCKLTGCKVEDILEYVSDEAKKREEKEEA